MTANGVDWDMAMDASSTTRNRRKASLPLLVLGIFLWVGCGDPADSSPAPDVTNWTGVQEDARGQTVRWWMFGGDERVNRYVDRFVIPAAAELGVVLERVPIADTGDAVQRVLAEKMAGVEHGSLDLIWINGENFAIGKKAGLWMEDWATALPNAQHIDWEDATMTFDFGVPVEGQESPWSRAAFVFAYDPERTPNPPRTFGELVAYARDQPGRVTYPAPPDFTGSAFVRLAVQTLGEDRAFRLLEEMKPYLWREGKSYPGSEAELNRLFGNGQVDLAMSYNPAFVAAEVSRGTFSPSTRPFTMETGTLHNVSYVTIPGNAPSPQGALIVANLLLEPRLQAVKADHELLGAPTVLDLALLSSREKSLFASPSQNDTYLLEDLDPKIRELSPERVTEIEERWRRDILR